MQLQEKQMRSNQIAGIYGGGGSMPMGNRAPVAGNAGGKKTVPSNVNVGKPANQKEALQMLNQMMNHRVSGKKETQYK